LSVRSFRWAAVVLSTAGLVLLYLMATHREIPVVRIGDVEPTMNFAYVRVVGKVIEEPRINREGEIVRSVRFTVSDGTGEIPVMAFRAKGEALVAQDHLPQVGDHVDVTGSLSVSAERMGLWLQAPEQLRIEPGQVLEVALGDITEEMIGSRVDVRGRITEVRPPRQGSRRPWSVTIEDESGRQDLSFWRDVYEDIEEKVKLAPGAHIQARVVVGSFRDKIQLRLSRASELQFVSEAAKQS